MRSTRFAGRMLPALWLALVALLAGCGDASRPTAPDGTTTLGTTPNVAASRRNQPPFGLIITPANLATYAQGVSILFTGSATDPEDGVLSGASIVWRSSIDGQIGTGTAFTKSNLSVGQHTITMTSTDSKGASFSHNRLLNITAPVNRPPVAAITLPANNASVAQGAAVSFAGTGTDPESGALSGASLVWTSSLSGQIGTGTSFSTTTLAAGTHTITLTAKDAQNATGTAAVTVTITSSTNQPPFGLIATPTNLASYPQGTAILFTGSATDPEDGVLSGASIVWRSSIDGEIGTGTSFTKSNLSVGQHTITMTSTDSKGGSFSHNELLNITTVTNRPPVAAITLPANNASVGQGAAVSFAGTGTDPESGALSGASLVWTSSLSGQIGTGTSFSTTTLAAGTHTITLTAKDAQNATGTAVVTVTITASTNQPPFGLIATPTNLASYAQGVSILFNGSATDPEDGVLSGASIVWRSSIDGQIGTGTSFTKSNLSVGQHTITMTSTDSKGASFSHNVLLNITALVTQAIASRLAITVQPSASVQSGVAFPQQPVVQLRDASNNPVSQSGIVVAVAIASGGGTLGGIATATTNASGVASFANLSISGTAGSRTLLATATSLTSVTSNAISVGVPVVTGEPSYVAGSGATLVMQDNMDRYTSAISMGAYPYQYSGPMFTPVPAPSQTSQPVDTAHVTLVSPGRGGAGKALRMTYAGVYQESHNWATINLPSQPNNQTVYIQYYARVTPTGSWPLSQPLAVKWLMAWHNISQGTRVEWNTRYPSSSDTRETAPTVWQVIDQGESPTNGDQPFGPFFHQLADGQWHRYTHAFRPHSSSAVKDGYSKMWVDGTLIIDIEQATVGVIPPGGVTVWCSQADVDDLSVADGVAYLKFGGPQTTTTGAWIYDIDDLMWWRQ